jgi:hypothetical protein
MSALAPIAAVGADIEISRFVPKRTHAAQQIDLKGHF